MAWRFRKYFSRGPLRLTLSKRGVGTSFGVPGLRFGHTPKGRLYFSLGFPGTGFYWQKFFGSGKNR